MKLIPLSKGQFALVDDEDFESVNAFKWSAVFQRNNYRALRGYTGEDGKVIYVYLHRFLMNPPADMVVDHIDKNPLNNQRSNLRICTKRENSFNRSACRNNTSGFKGVYRNCSKTNPWLARLETGGKAKSLGNFETRELAAAAYDAAAKERHGEFASLNFPPPEMT
jgi:hypothetical protein